MHVEEQDQGETGRRQTNRQSQAPHAPRQGPNAHFACAPGSEQQAQITGGKKKETPLTSKARRSWSYFTL